MSEYKKKIISLNGNRKLIYAVKKEGLKTLHPCGKWNGYGYEKLPLAVSIESLGEMRRFNKIVREVEHKPAPKQKTEEEKIEAWSRRLARLTNITVKEAIEIAKEKIEYKEQKIEEVENRQYEHYSHQRATLISKMRRENPLRYIKDADHAFNILLASHRHNCTNYDDKLEEGRELANVGIIDRSEVKDYARTKCK